MQRFVLFFTLLIVSAFGRRNAPSSKTPGAWGLQGNHPYAAWGIQDEVAIEEIEAKIEPTKDAKAIKQVKRSK